MGNTCECLPGKNGQRKGGNNLIEAPSGYDEVDGERPKRPTIRKRESEESTGNYIIIIHFYSGARHVF